VKGSSHSLCGSANCPPYSARFSGPGGAPDDPTLLGGGGRIRCIPEADPCLKTSVGHGGLAVSLYDCHMAPGEQLDLPPPPKGDAFGHQQGRSTMRPASGSITGREPSRSGRCGTVPVARPREGSDRHRPPSLPSPFWMPDPSAHSPLLRVGSPSPRKGVPGEWADLHASLLALLISLVFPRVKSFPKYF